MIKNQTTRDWSDGTGLPTYWRVASIVIYGFAQVYLGLFIALPLLVVISSRAGDEFYRGEALANAAVLTSRGARRSNYDDPIGRSAGSSCATEETRRCRPKC